MNRIAYDTVRQQLPLSSYGRLRAAIKLAAQRVLSLIVFAAVCGPSGVVSAECGCLSGGHHTAVDCVCLPQPTTLSVEVTEWGIQSDMICPAHSGLFGSRCNCAASGLEGGCVASCDAGCASGCDAGCDAHCTAGLAGLDSDCGLTCNCGAGGHGSGLWGRCVLPGTGARPRNRLMRKTLVYTVPSQQWVPQAYSVENCGPLVPTCSDPATAVIPPDRVPPAADTLGFPSVSVWMNRQVMAATSLLPELQSLPAPVVTAAAHELIPGDRTTGWIDRHGFEHVEHLGTMEAVTDNQPPAPISFAPTAAAADAWPTVSPSEVKLR